MSATDPQCPYPETADIHTSSDEYALRFSGPAGEWMLAVQERIALRMVRRFPDATILDVGGGHGQLALPLCRDGRRGDGAGQRRLLPAPDPGRGGCGNVPVRDGQRHRPAAARQHVSTWCCASGC
jgi:hypothetical protein